ncbi:transcriptional antiterminator [Marinovum sp. 2_MG-2023]|uniref:ANTAR domain-containing response regulator n=1 Tax=unclassified Marinovum TaxID=2647166 RepID=UPI0026E208E1|nr:MULTISPECIES: transcriptional antiterminator [unclassified Marinovum]MDO6731160.1 transcriptional antiterminator [Marinovum sp. 2_MG-2023]MDO6778657.1 transcriptional antiterminator [Marinovum sp. 1_MG-2023]
MKRRGLPNFRNVRALIVHPPGDNSAVLTAQLGRLGLCTESIWPADNVSPEGYDVIFFDADRGYDQQFGWERGQAPIPLIALMGSEAPGRIEWTLGQMPSAYLVKPLQPTGIFSALVVAFHDFEVRTRLMRKVEDLNARLRARPTVVAAITLVQSCMTIDSQAAYDLLRSEAMRLQVSVEFLCEQIETTGSLTPLKTLAESGTNPNSPNKRLGAGASANKTGGS